MTSVKTKKPFYYLTKLAVEVLYFKDVFWFD